MMAASRHNAPVGKQVLVCFKTTHIERAGPRVRRHIKLIWTGIVCFSGEFWRHRHVVARAGPAVRASRVPGPRTIDPFSGMRNVG
jgi:hypothetical protein